MTPEVTQLRPIPVTWNDERLLAAAGGNPKTVKQVLLEAKQPVPSDMAIYQWVSRGVIAHHWRPRLLYALLRAGKVQFAEVFALAD